MATDALMIREWVTRYVSGTISLREFKQWFVPMTWDLDLEADAVLRDLCGEIELDLAEYSNGDWTEDELRLHMRH